MGIDASPTLVRLAVTHPERETAVLADAARLPFPDEAFDLVVAYMSLHDIDEMAQAVAEAARVLGRSGRPVRRDPPSGEHGRRLSRPGKRRRRS